MAELTSIARELRPIVKDGGKGIELATAIGVCQKPKAARR
jgi:hypothetical protein